jgi:endo-1,3-1,4-beta-glycanase ExoK
MQLPSSPSMTLRILSLSLLLSSAVALPVHALGGSFGDNLNSYDTSRWMKADGWTNGGVFNCGWRADHSTFSGGLMTLQLDNATCPSGCSGKPYASDEYRTNDVYGYGTYTVHMRAAKGSGIVSSFFTYNGSPWDEIDIEFLGKDTTKMQTNYFTNGVGGHETLINLGFDASAALHTYTFVWQSGSIKWYVDGVLVLTETGTRGPLPTNPGKIMMNLWPGTGVDSWLGPFTYTGPITAQYDSIQYAP